MCVCAYIYAYILVTTVVITLFYCVGFVVFTLRALPCMDMVVRSVTWWVNGKYPTATRVPSELSPCVGVGYRCTSDLPVHRPSDLAVYSSSSSVL